MPEGSVPSNRKGYSPSAHVIPALNLVEELDEATIMIAGMVVAFGLGSAAAFAATSDKPPAPPGQPNCEHGNDQKPCKDDPQPNHGQDCEEHGNLGGQNRTTARRTRRRRRPLRRRPPRRQSHPSPPGVTRAATSGATPGAPPTTSESSSMASPADTGQATSPSGRRAIRQAQAEQEGAQVFTPPTSTSRPAHVGGGGSGQQDSGGALDGGALDGGTASSVHALA